MLLSLLGSFARLPSALVGALMLLHVVLPREGFAAIRAEDVFLARVFLPVPRGVAGCGEGVGAVEPLRVRTLVLVFLRCRLQRRLRIQW